MKRKELYYSPSLIEMHKQRLSALMLKNSTPKKWSAVCLESLDIISQLQKELKDAKKK